MKSQYQNLYVAQALLIRAMGGRAGERWPGLKHRLQRFISGLSPGRRDYRLEWLDDFAADVTIEGSVLAGLIDEPEAVRARRAFIADTGSPGFVANSGG